MRRVSGLWAFALGATLCLSAACFGDNTDGNDDSGGLPDGKPAVLELSTPVDLDVGDGFDLTVRVKGKSNEQLSVALDAKLGTFTQQNKLIITDDSGEGTFSTRYTSSGTAGTETLTANVSSPGSSGTSQTRSLTIFDVERLGNVSPVGTATTQTAGVLIAYPMDLTTERVVRKLGITHPTQTGGGTVNATVGLYTTDTATSLNVVARKTVSLVAGANEIEIPATSLQAGRYWFVIIYDGSPQVYRSTDIQVTLLYKLGHTYELGLPDTLVGLATSDNVNSYYARNLYLVLRK